MKKIKLLALCAIVAGFATSCQKDEIAAETQETVVEQPTKDQIKALLDAGVNTSDVTVGEFKGLPGDTPIKALFAGDLIIPADELAKGTYALQQNTDGTKQYRTTNLVTGSNTSFRVVGYTGSCCALTSKMRTALQWAVNNYNRLNSSLNLTLVFSSSFNNSDMVVYNNGLSGGGGSAGFPSGGEVFKRVQINAGTDAFSTNVNEHVITHEIGHSIGFRHQDWQSRQSCGQNTNEGTAGVGAILIPGTASSDTAPSIMQACFGGNEDGEFKGDDVRAIETIY